MIPGSHVTRLRNIGFYAAPPVHAVRPHPIIKGEELVELVTEGSIFFDIDGREAKLGCGALFWHQAGDHTIHRTLPDSPYRCLTVAFKVQQAARRPVPRVTFVDNPNRVHELSRELLEAYHDERVDRRFLCAYACQRLLWEAHRSMHRDGVPRRPARVERLVAFIEEHYGEDVSTRDMAATVEISEPHLHVLFRKYLNTTPYQFLLERRVREARLQLAGSNHPIKTISAACGFANIETFYRCFKSRTGVTPKAYREKHADPLRARLR